uniref:Uncharacterized protein n=1 Tax=Tanacetum cinerariifolium TaxID=118510 RepID=A0A6L2N793_TANCI|nr:hypothetical protein [Tanacetum cinerariifolium]
MTGDPAKKEDCSSSLDLNLTFGNPLYLHPNDTGGSPIVTIKLTGTDNYKDDTNHTLANQWDMCNYVMFTWILNSLSPDLYVGAIYAKTVSELWTDLKDIYDKVDGSTVFNLHKSINSLSQSVASLAYYYNNLKSLWKQFDVMISLPICTCDAAKHFEKHNQLIKLMQFLMGLDENYLAIRSNILTREPLPLVKAAFAIGPNPNLKCNNCNKIGHTVDSCFEIISYPAGYVKRNFNSNYRPVTSNNSTVDPNFNNAGSSTIRNSPVSLSNKQLTKLMNHLNDNGVSFANANMSVNVVDISNLDLTVGHPNGTQALITKVRDLKINNNITLYDVLVVPEYTTSLNLDSQTASVHLCDTCNKAKQTRNPFLLSDHKSSKIELNYDVEELRANIVRRSSRHAKLPSSLNDFIIERKVKYSVERVVNYANLNHANYCFIFALNKSIKPTCY